MMKQDLLVPFVKYTANGNTFVIVDEVAAPHCIEEDFRRLSYVATNAYFGIGCDNFLVVQKATERVLRDINRRHRYWEDPPSIRGVSYLFRMFEPNGTEALCCGNGLMCIADYLYTQYGVTNASILTELPSSTPRPVRIGVAPAEGLGWVNLGWPRRASDQLVRVADRRSLTRDVDLMEQIWIKFRSHDLSPYTKSQRIGLRGYLTFTGEPHLVVFPDTDITEKVLTATFFPEPTLDSEGRPERDRRRSFGTWLVHHIGSYINRRYGNIYPFGINVSFALCRSRKGIIEYRCFERGINRETLACGTGALAVAHISRTLGLIEKGSVVMVPHRSRWYLPTAAIEISKDNDGWQISSYPQSIASGLFAPMAPNSPAYASTSGVATIPLSSVEPQLPGVLVN